MGSSAVVPAHGNASMLLVISKAVSTSLTLYVDFAQLTDLLRAKVVVASTLLRSTLPLAMTAQRSPVSPMCLVWVGSV